MTREEALQNLDTIPTIGEQVDALEMAIEVLSAEPCEDCISRNLCDSCKTKGCIFQSGIVRSHCDFYRAESER